MAATILAIAALGAAPAPQSALVANTQPSVAVAAVNETHGTVSAQQSWRDSRPGSNRDFTTQCRCMPFRGGNAADCARYLNQGVCYNQGGPLVPGTRATCYWGPRNDTSCRDRGYPYCASHDLFSRMMDARSTIPSVADEYVGVAGAEITVTHNNPMVVTLVLCIILLLSLVILFFGQALATPALIIVTLLVSGVISFGLLTILIDRTSGPGGLTGDFVPCGLPIVLSVLLALITAGLISFLALKVTWLTTAIFGACLGVMLMFFLRSIIITLAPAVLSDYVINYYWLATIIVALVVAVISSLCVTSDGRKSLIILASSSLVGAFGLTTSISSLVNLYVSGPGFESWAVLVFFVCMAIAGFLFQACLTGPDAAENREATRKRVRRETLNRSMMEPMAKA